VLLNQNYKILKAMLKRTSTVAIIAIAILVLVAYQTWENYSKKTV